MMKVERTMGLKQHPEGVLEGLRERKELGWKKKGINIHCLLSEGQVLCWVAVNNFTSKMLGSPWNPSEYSHWEPDALKMNQIWTFPRAVWFKNTDSETDKDLNSCSTLGHSFHLSKPQCSHWEMGMLVSLPPAFSKFSELTKIINVQLNLSLAHSQ